MKRLRTLLSLSLLLATLASCVKNPPRETTADPLGTPTVAPTNEVTTTAETAETTADADPNASSFYELSYMNEIREPIPAGYCIEDLQWRTVDGTRREFTLVSRVYNSSGTPIVVSGATMSLKMGNVSSQNILCATTPFYLMPYQTGYVVVQSRSRADSSIDFEDVDYTYAVTAKGAKNDPVSYYAENATATVEHRGKYILGVQLDIVMRDPPATRFIQVNGVLYNKEGIAVDAFSSKLTQRNGVISLVHFPDMNLSTDEIASYSFTLTSQCNE